MDDFSKSIVEQVHSCKTAYLGTDGTLYVTGSGVWMNDYLNAPKVTLFSKTFMGGEYLTWIDLAYLGDDKGIRIIVSPKKIQTMAALQVHGLDGESEPKWAATHELSKSSQQLELAAKGLMKMREDSGSISFHVPSNGIFEWHARLNERIGSAIRLLEAAAK